VIGAGEVVSKDSAMAVGKISRYLADLAFNSCAVLGEQIEAKGKRFL
jgi:hypothetical protein